MNAGIDKIKAWMFPGLITVLGAMLWYDIREIKSDVKVLMAQSNIDKTRIDNLEREVFEYHRNKPVNNNNQEPFKRIDQLVFIRPEDYSNKKLFRPDISSTY